MHDLSSYKFWIEVGGVRATEYNKIPQPKEKTTSCYIESVPEKRFILCGSRHEGATPVVVKVFINGLQAKVSIWHSGTSWKLSHIQAQNAVKHFMFSTMEITGSDRRDNVGMLKVQIYPAENIEYLKDVTYTCNVDPRLLDQPGGVNEKSAQAGFHTVSLQNTDQPIQALSMMNSKGIDIQTELHTFLFHYRPRYMLQAKEIMPLSPLSMVDRVAGYLTKFRVWAFNRKKLNVSGKSTMMSSGESTSALISKKLGLVVDDEANHEWPDTDHLPEYTPTVTDEVASQ